MIFGRDLVYDLDAQAWKGQPTESADSGIRNTGERFTGLVKNAYRVLLSRGIKGCFVCFLDKDTERFVRSRMEAPAGAALGQVADGERDPYGASGA